MSAFENILKSIRKGYRVQLKNNKLHTDDMNELEQQTLNHQLKIDAIYFARGYLSSSWEVLQNLYLKRLDYNKKLTDWSTKTIKAIWNYCGFLNLSITKSLIIFLDSFVCCCELNPIKYQFLTHRNDFQYNLSFC